MNLIHRIFSGSLLRQIIVGFTLILMIFGVIQVSAQMILAVRFFDTLAADTGNQQSLFLARLTSLALYTENKSLAQEPLEAIVERPEILSAALYLGDGTLWIKQQRQESTKNVLTPEKAKQILTEIASSKSARKETGNTLCYYAPVKVTNFSTLDSRTEVEETIGLARIILNKDYFQKLAKQRLLLNSVSFICAILIALLTAIILARYLSTPLHKLTEGAERIAKGELDKPIPVETTGELANLTVAFNRMLNSLKEREQLMSELRQAQKMEAIGTLAGGIAHDFNNILGAIFGYTQLSMLKIDKDSEEYNNLSQVLLASTRAKDLVASILTFSRQASTEKKAIPIASIIKEVLKLLRATTPAGIEIQQQIDMDTGNVNADPIQIHQIVMNLCANAFHAMGNENGILKITLEELEVDSKQAATIPELQPGKHILFTVSDTGHGMDNDLMERIFDPFYTTKERGKGTGLGLSVVHGIIAESGGAIQVESKIDKGTTFFLYFPVAEQSDEEPDSLLEAHLHKGSGNILLIDDEVSLVQSGQQMLEYMGYTVTSMTSSLDAYELFQKQPEMFDLIITDQAMPSMQGTELAEKIFAIRPGIPIILCTGYSANITEKSIKEIGIQQLVMKPLSLEKISQSLDKLEPDGGTSSA
ncbi:MAG: response regulator [Desulfocapsa sp.]|nr:response regulator [Desulfocapsa sp.]